jgi:hypothetical protein
MKHPARHVDEKHLQKTRRMHGKGVFLLLKIGGWKKFDESKWRLRAICFDGKVGETQFPLPDTMERKYN